MTTHKPFLSQVKHLVKQKQYQALENLFLEHLTRFSEPLNLNEFWEAIDYLSQINQETLSLAKDMSIFIAEHLIENHHYQEALAHFQKVMRYIETAPKIRAKIIDCYKQLYQDKPHFNLCLIKSGITEHQSLDTALSALNKLIRLEPGTPVYASRYGYGEIQKVDFLLDTIAIEIYDRGLITITFEQALKSLQIVSQDNFYILRAKKPDQLKKLINESPETLQAIIERDVLTATHKTSTLSELSIPAEETKKSICELKPSAIRQLLKGFISDVEIEQFINQIKKKTSTLKSAVDTKKRVTPKPELSIDIERLSDNEIFGRLNSVPVQSIKVDLLKTIVTKRADGITILTKLFLSQNNKRILQNIYNLFDENARHAIISKIDTEYKTYPEHFLWLTDIKIKEKNYSFNPLSELIRFLDIASNVLTKQYASVVRKKIIASDYALIRNALVELESNQAEDLWTKINRLNNLYPEELDAIKSLFQQKFPDLFQEKDDYLYNTQSAIRNKEQELKRLISQELPNCANEVARARSFGDLSENYEYKAALEKQRRLMNKVIQIQKELAKSRVIDFNTIDTSKVNIGTSVKLMPFDDSQEQNILTYTILGPWDSDLSKGIISYLAPFAQTLLGKTIGDEIINEQGKRFRIIEITKCILSE